MFERLSKHDSLPHRSSTRALDVTIRPFRLLLVLLLPLAFQMCASSAGPAERVPLTYRPDIVDGRELFIYVPPAYDSSSSRYPVVYMNDGDALFGPQGWSLERTLDELIGRGIIDPLIVVGVGSSVQRTSEYVPYFDQWIIDNWGAYSPSAAGYVRFVVERVIPYVDSSYKTIPDRTARGFMGVSLGGLAALWGVVQHDSIFSMGAGLSPSLWIDDYRYIRDMGSVPRKDLRFWFDMGTVEWNYYVPLIDTLRAKGYGYGTDVAYYEELGGKHIASAWVRRIQYPLIMFNGRPASVRVSHEMVLEVIPRSDQTGYYYRLNPVVDMDNGLRYSLSTTASYTALNPSAGTVNNDGSFLLSGPDTLFVRVELGSLVDTVRITPEEIEILRVRL